MKTARLSTIIVMAGLALAVWCNPAHAGLEDILYEKGQITKEEWLKAKAAAEKTMGPLEKLEEWQKKVSKLPILSDKFNIGVNVLQVQYLNNEAQVTPGNADNRFFIRRAELIAWGKVNDYFPRWHMLADFGALSNVTNNVNSGSNNQILREAYVDIVPALSAQPYIDRFRIGQYRIPVGIEGSTSSGLIDFVNRNYITQAPNTSGGTAGVAAAAGTLGSTGTQDFIPERDIYADLKSKPLEQVELDLGIMNGNGINSIGASIDNNDQKDFFGRARIKPRKDMFASFGTIQGYGTNLNSRNGGRGKGVYDRYIADFQFKPQFVPGLWLQGEFAWGHDAPAAGTTSGAGFDSVTSPARGELRSAWYVYGKYLFQTGPLKDWELLARYEEYDPSRNVSQDMLYRTTFGINYYFANLPPRVQAKLMLNYEIRRHSGDGPLRSSITALDEFGHDALLIQLHVRWF